jgi:CubicO group peptidase (beta-lactamase class C family)
MDTFKFEYYIKIFTFLCGGNVDMKKKLLCILLVTLLIGIMTLPVTGKMTISLTFDKNRNNIFSNYFFTNEGNCVLNDDLDDFIISVMENKHIPGLSASIIKNGAVLWTDSYGYADIDNGTYVENNTLFILASISKTITATAIMQLYEQEYFDLNDPINDYLPFDVIHPTFPSTDITFHMLLTHSSSIKDNWDVMTYYVGDSPIPLGTYLEDYLTPSGQYYDPTLNFYSAEPGTIYRYCNIAIALVGYLVEEIFGTPFDEYCETYIFEPLDMDETAWFLADLDVNNIAIPYQWNGDDYIPYDHYGYSDYPSGQLRTSVIQLYNFLMMMMNNGEYNSTQILEDSTVELMLSPQLPFDPSQGLIWYEIEFDGRTLWGHNGGDFGCFTEMYFEPETDIGVIIFTNGESSYDEIITTLFNYAENAPFPPDIDGPISGKPRTEYTYTAITSDPDGDNVSYFFDWGDLTNSGWTEYIPSGTPVSLNHSWLLRGKTPVSLNHSWLLRGNYIIKVKAKDENGMESDWGTFQVTIPRNKAINNPFLNWLQSHPFLFPLLQKLIQQLGFGL